MAAEGATRGGAILEGKQRCVGYRRDTTSRASSKLRPQPHQRPCRGSTAVFANGFVGARMEPSCLDLANLDLAT